MSNKNILVTGGAGYIGSHTVLEILDNTDWKVTIFDTKEPLPSFTKVLETYADRVVFVCGNLLRIDDLNSLFANNSFDAVIHFAAYIEVGESQIEPSKYYRNNVVGSLNLFESCRENNVDKLVFSSTAAAYGTPEYTPIDEQHPAKPINTYGYSKVVVENILHDFSRSYGFNSVILRYFNACGADPLGRTGESHDPETHLIPNILKSFGTDKKFTLFGNDYPTPDGTCVRDYIHVKDLASGHIAALNLLLESDKCHEVINLAGGNGKSNLEIMQTVESVTGQKVNYEFGPRRDGDPGVLIADNSKAKTMLHGWQPQHSDLETIIATAWAWEKGKK